MWYNVSIIIGRQNVVVCTDYKLCPWERVAGSRPRRTWLRSDVTALNRVSSARRLSSSAVGAVCGRYPNRFVLAMKLSSLPRSPELAKPHHAGEAYINRAMVDARQTSCRAPGGRPWFRRTRSAYNDDEQPLITSPMCASILKLS